MPEDRDSTLECPAFVLRRWFGLGSRRLRDCDLVCAEALEDLRTFVAVFRMLASFTMSILLSHTSRNRCLLRMTTRSRQ